MRFNEWQDKLQKQHERIAGVPLAEISEVMFLDGSSIVVSIGKKYCAEIDSKEFGVRNLRGFYTAHKDEFGNLLESITEQTNVVAEVTNTLLEAVTADSMPEIIMDRLQGKQEQDSVEMVRELTGKRLLELWHIWDRRYVTNQFVIELGVAGKDLQLNQNGYIGWGKLVTYGKAPPNVDDVEECLFFLSQFDIIKAKVEQVADALMRLGKQLK